MGVTILPSTLLGGYTPICSSCGATESWDISEEDYQRRLHFWDQWLCEDCRNPNDLTY